ncbi:MAG TPA: sigma-70 family RNA polymerase sigma factor [Longimicrobium sp.]|nr:sigma-70 family RNA polymerase sigma factor [Longimicrobium sp.]
MTHETDAELVARVRRGDRAAAGALAERWLRACRAVALAVTASEPDADDVCQDAFVAAMEGIDGCRRPERFGAWLLQIVRNRARDHLRERARKVIPIDGVELPSAEPSPQVAAERADARTRLLAALRELPEERREVLLLHDLEGWTHREIAERMGLPPGTVRSHLHHARRKIRSLLPELEDDTDG